MKAATRRAAVVLLVLGVALYPTTRLRIFTFDSDASAYIGAARSMLSGHGYSLNGEPTEYPPGTSILIEPFVHAGRPFLGAGIAGLHVYMALFGVAGFLVSFAFMRNRDEPLAFWLCLMIWANAAYYMSATGGVSSDVPYLVFSMSFLLWFERGEDAGERKGALGWLLGVVLLVMAMLLRSVSIALIGGLALTTAVRWRRNRSRMALPLVTLGVAVLAFLVSSFLNHSQGSYISQLLMVDPHQPDLGQASFGTFLGRAPVFLAERGAALTQALTNYPWFQRALLVPPVLLAVVCCITGWVQDVRSNELAGWYVLCYVGVMLFWPYGEGTRFLVPVLPLFLVYGARGSRTAFRWMAAAPGTRLTWVGLAAACGFVILLGNVPSAMRGANRLAWLTGRWGVEYEASLVFWPAAAVLAFFLAAKRSRPAVARQPGATTGRRLGRAAAASYLAAYGILGFGQIRDRVRYNLHVHPETMLRATARRAAIWINAHADPGDRIMADDREALVLTTDRHVELLPATGIHPSRYAIALCRERPRYVVVNDSVRHPNLLPQDPERLIIMQRVFPGSFRLVQRLAEVSIYEVDTASAAFTRTCH